LVSYKAPFINYAISYLYNIIKTGFLSIKIYGKILDNCIIKSKPRQLSKERRFYEEGKKTAGSRTENYDDYMGKPATCGYTYPKTSGIILLSPHIMTVPQWRNLHL